MPAAWPTRCSAASWTCSITIPFLVLVIAIVAVLGPGLINMYIAISAVNWIFYARLMRGEIMAQKRRDYAAAGRVMGYGALRIIFRHLLPNAISPDHRLLDDRHGAGDPAGLQPRLSRPRRAAADGGMGRADRRRQELHDHGVVDVDLSRHRHRARRHRLQPAGRRAGQAGCAGDDACMLSRVATCAHPRSAPATRRCDGVDLRCERRRDARHRRRIRLRQEPDPARDPAAAAGAGRDHAGAALWQGQDLLALPEADDAAACAGARSP